MPFIPGLEGYHTYIVVIASLCYAWGGFVSGNITMDAAIQITLLALGGAGLRNAVNKVGR